MWDRDQAGDRPPDGGPGNGEAIGKADIGIMSARDESCEDGGVASVHKGLRTGNRART